MKIRVASVCVVRKLGTVLESIARRLPGHSLSPLDRTRLAMSNGFGHAAVEALFFCVSWLPLSSGRGTFYTDKCPQLSYFLAAALLTLGVSAFLVSAMVVAFDGMDVRDGTDSKRSGGNVRAFGPSVLHFVLALTMLGNFAQGGCIVTIPCTLAIGLGTTVWAVAGVWGKPPLTELPANNL
jgi:gamma-secretase subunit APH-1